MENDVCYGLLSLRVRIGADEVAGDVTQSEHIAEAVAPVVLPPRA